MSVDITFYKYCRFATKAIFLRNVTAVNNFIGATLAIPLIDVLSIYHFV